MNVAPTHRPPPGPGTAPSLLICALFGALWGITGSLALVGVWRWLGLLLVVAVTSGLLLAAFTAVRRGARQPNDAAATPHNPFRTRSYLLAVGGMLAAFPIAGRVLTATGYADAIIAVVALIVGLHFFGLVPAFRSRIFAVVGAAFCGLALVALALPAILTLDDGTAFELRRAVVGWGCALILWLSCLPLVQTTRHGESRSAAGRS